MIKRATKKGKTGNVDGFLKDGYEDLKGRVQVYSSGEDGGGLYKTLGIAGDGQIFSLWVIGYEVETRKVKVRWCCVELRWLKWLSWGQGLVVGVQRSFAAPPSSRLQFLSLPFPFPRR
jgi:hypothetical protein